MIQTGIKSSEVKLFIPLRRDYFFLAFGIALVALYVLVPYLYSYFHTPEGSVWVPVNDQFHICSDEPFYGSTVRQARDSFFHFESPVRKEPGRAYWLDIFRAGSNRLAAILGLFMSDQRVAHPLSFISSVVLQFGLVFLFGVLTGLPGLQASFLGWLTVFGLPLINSGFDLKAFSNFVFNLDGTLFFELKNDHFRYLVLSTAILFAWFFLIILWRWEKEPTYKNRALLVLALFALPYSYISITLCMGLFGLFFWIQLLFEKKWHKAKDVVVLSCVALVALSLVGFWHHLSMFFSANSDVIMQSHFFENNSGWPEVFQRIIRDPLVILSVVFCMMIWILVDLRRFFLAFLLAVLAIKAIAFFPRGEHLSYRLFIRGVNSIWLFFLVWCFLHILRGWASRVPSAKSPWRQFTVIANCLLVLVMLSPLIGSYRMADRLTQYGSYYVPEGQWQAYEYLSKKTRKESVVLALDFSDLQLLPVYTHAQLYFAGSNWTGAPSAEAVSRYSQGLKLAGVNRAVAQDWLQDYVRAEKRFRCAPMGKASFEEVEGFLMFQSLTYDPMVQTFDGVRIRSESGEALTKEFLTKIDSLFNTPAPTQEIDFIVLSERIERRRIEPHGTIPGFNLVFETKDRRVYQRVSGS